MLPSAKAASSAVAPTSAPGSASATGAKSEATLSSTNQRCRPMASSSARRCFHQRPCPTGHHARRGTQGSSGLETCRSDSRSRRLHWCACGLHSSDHHRPLGPRGGWPWVTRDVDAFAIVAGTPARRIGWVGRAGVPLTKGNDGVWNCPETQERYAEGETGLEELP